MQIFRRIIGLVVLTSVVFFAVSGPINTVDSTIRLGAIGVIFIGGIMWFLMQIAGSQKPNKEAQKPQKNNFQKPSAKEDELIQYIRSNVVVSDTCSTSRYNNKHINLECLVQDISNFYVRNFNWPKPTQIQFDNIISLVNDESIVVLIKGVNNIVVKVHVPDDIREVKTSVSVGALLAEGHMSEDDLIAGGGSGRINLGLAIRKELSDRKTSVEALRQHRRRLEESIAKYIDEHIRNDQSSQKNETVDMMYLRNLRNWRT